MQSRRPATSTLSLAMGKLAVAAAAVAATALVTARAEDSQAAVAAPAGTVVRTVHAVGAQIYECKTDGHAGLAWSFREPVATLISDGTTVGRHFAGPSWEMVDGSLVVGTVVATASGTAVDDIPWLRLDVSQHHGSGILGDVTVIQRLSTVGGKKSGPCPTVGALFVEPYSAIYVFLRP
ncbi:MAG: DUF3455 domain-containing protein [Janthinobacterium lividum]